MGHDSYRNKVNNMPWLKDARKNLRTNGTSAEAALWRALKNRQLDGWRWRRQHSIGDFILDFYCPKAKLAIELDGQHHFTAIGKGEDNLRMKELAELGIRVLRFENREIWDMPQAVINAIKDALNER